LLPIDLDAEDTEVARDLASLDVEQLADDAEQLTEEVDEEVDADGEADAQAEPEGSEGSSEIAVKDGGDLYGVHVAPASDRAHLDDDEAFEDGQNWVESLHTDAAEGGPEPEHEVDILDEHDLTSSSADSKDRPIADRGSAGPRGL
jgi:hypothetical protein